MPPSDPGNPPGPGTNDNSTPEPDPINRDCEADIADEVKHIKASGRGIRRLVTLCGTVTQLIAEYDRRLLESESDDDAGNEGDGSDEDIASQMRVEVQRRRDRDYQSYLELVKLIPSMKDKIVDPHRRSRVTYYGLLLDGANSARSDDISRVKSIVAKLLNTRMNGPPDTLLDQDTREGRGLQNDYTGRLLCPIKYDWEDPIIRAKIREGCDGYNAFDYYWLRCLYEGETGDPKDVETGFLKNALLVKTFQMIFTSPSSAQGNLDAEPVPEPRGRRKKGTSKRPPVAAQLRMDGRVTARAIAYCAVQLHFALSDATQWVNQFNGFNYEEFYEFIVDYFEADQTPEGKAASGELYAWWNERVFPMSATTRAAARNSARRSSLAILRDQRKAIRSARIPA